MAVALSNSHPYAAPIDLAPVRPSIAAGDTALGKLAFIALWIFVFVMPWEESVPLWGGFVISRWVALASGSLLALAVLSTRRLRRPCALHGIMLAFVVWTALTLFWTIDSELTQIRVGTYAQLLLAVWMMWELAITEDRVISLLQAYMTGATVMSVTTIVNYSLGIQAADLAEERGIVKYHDQRYTMLGINENDLALMIALSLPIAIYLLTRARSRWLKLYCWAHLGISLVALFLDGSRTGMFATAVALCAFPVLMSRMTKTQRVAFILVVGLGIAGGIYFVPEDVWHRLMNTGVEISQGTLTHRTMLWDAGIEAFRDHPFIGIGSGAYAAAIVKVTNFYLVAHNSYLSVLVELGVVGFILFAALLISLYLSAWRLAYAERRLWIILLLTWSVGVFALTWEYRKPTWFLFGALAAHVYSRRKSNGL